MKLISTQRQTTTPIVSLHSLVTQNAVCMLLLLQFYNGYDIEDNLNMNS